MVGRDIAARTHERTSRAQPVLRVEGLARAGIFEDISFDVRAGEIVALAGLVGAGRSEVARARLRDRPLRRRRRARSANGRCGGARRSTRCAAGIAFVPEDRRQQGLVMDMSIVDNVALASLRRLRRRGLLFGSVERRFAADWAARLQVKYSRIGNPVTSLSGGNQQKVVLAKWLSREPTVMIVDEPTRGIDIATKGEVHRILAELGRRAASPC